MDNNKSGKIKIAIQGGFGAFHEIAARHYFETENIEIVPRNTFKDLFKSLKSRQADYGIMAIENSVAGSILPNYTLIMESGKKIIGEIFLRIKQNLVALPGQKISDIKEVYSHSMAILQCQPYFEKFPHIRLIESIDTALSAKEIRENELKGVGAIASHLAAEKYDLEILAESIETNKLNYTRFLILSDNGDLQNSPDNNKTSIYFSLSHKIGSLSKILSILSYYEMNLTKIQSMPIVGKEWHYHFYADMLYDDDELYRQSLNAIRPFTGELGILGEYKKGKRVL
ncbi:MAG: prephenate dehydratase [Bacteroidales bacterium]|nr:prephenate dehydratase [Bacteroidales bacterium]